MKIVITSLLLLGLVGCAKPRSYDLEQKRVEVMSDTDNWRFVVKEPNGNLSVMDTCRVAPLWKGLKADVTVQYDSQGRCYHVTLVTPVVETHACMFDGDSKTIGRGAAVFECGTNQ